MTKHAAKRAVDGHPGLGVILRRRANLTREVPHHRSSEIISRATWSELRQYARYILKNGHSNNPVELFEQILPNDDVESMKM